MDDAGKVPSNDNDHKRSLNYGISVYNEVREVVTLRGSRCNSEAYVGEKRNLVKWPLVFTFTGQRSHETVELKKKQKQMQHR